MYKNTLLLLCGALLVNPMVAIATQKETQKKCALRKKYDACEILTGAAIYGAVGTFATISGAHGLLHSKARPVLVVADTALLLLGIFGLASASFLAYNYFTKTIEETTKDWQCAKLELEELE